MPNLSQYNPEDFEILLLQEDLAQNRFYSKPTNKTPYTIVMPPPNVTGMLHMGHILNNTIQDVLIRYKRMQGFEACWIPGLDHASISTESKVIQWLSEQQINKQDIGREKFLEYAMQWKEKYGGIINDQLKRLGVSCDWSRERFTMDTEYSKAVLDVFVDLYREGLVYKGKRMVNWCPVSKSAISDEEVEHREDQGHLWHVAYLLKDSNESITIATTRPETMFGDVAVMVNPDDLRYQHLVGKIVLLPIVNKEIPIIADSYVDPEFGTGAVKVTPAHDPNDYEVGLRHQLEMPIVMTEEAMMNDTVPAKFRGLDRFEARKAVVATLKELNLLIKTENYTHKVGYSQRGNVPIESMLSEQWFISMKTLAAEAKKIVVEENIKFYPSHWTKTYYYWLDNIKDWCISRQLWWGHRIPVYTCTSCQHVEVSTDHVVSCPKCQSAMDQEESVLDTWASSWLWSYAVHKTEEERNYYHPTDTLVTGPDIIFFWVARMIMATQHFRKEIPFKNVYFTGIIRDDLGRKMSKSLGNSPDPLDIMKSYGADALRFSIIRLAPLGNDILYSSDQVDLGKRFANKIWNAARFIEMNIENNSFDVKTVNESKILSYAEDAFDKSILTRFNHVIQKIEQRFDRFRINEVAKEVYDFLWGDFCDRYVESSKFALTSGDPRLVQKKLSAIVVIFKRILKMLHPIMPFVTEKIMRELFSESHVAFMTYPQFDQKEIFIDTDEQMKRLEQALYMIREIRSENNVPPATLPTCTISVTSNLKEFFEQNNGVIEKLAKLSHVTVVDEDYQAKAEEATSSEFDFQVFLNLEGLIDKDKEIERLQKEIERLQKAEKSISGKLNNHEFTKKAPEAVVQKEKEKLVEIRDEIQKNRTSLVTYQR
ncbi:MAG: valine--tRNA ligase [Brevinema sp.]